MSIKDQTLLYLNSRGGKISPSPHPRFIEYSRLKLFWEKFGLNKFDIERCDPRWIDEIFQINSAVEEYISSQRTSNNSSSVSQGGKQVVRERLM